MRFLALALLSGCMPCDLAWAVGGFDDNKLDVVTGSTVLEPGDRVVLSMDSLDFHAGPDACRGHWYVNRIEGGNLEYGIITRCGTYTATAWPHVEEQVLVEATDTPIGTSADCGAYNQRKLTLLATWPRNQ